MEKSFYRIIHKLRNEKELGEIFKITLTDNEREMIAERWKIFEALSRGLSQREVARYVNCSVVTVTRGAKNYRNAKKKIDKYLLMVANSKPRK
ncbi:MAG: transcriptional regulator [Bacteroidetes bacterium]|nr:transcriptional regulator [Bacteroidota bacterium]